MTVRVTYKGREDKEIRNCEILYDIFIFVFMIDDR